ncbi:hypothetical protein, partial [Streptomyces sp. NPDC086777]|uniref:hypothetical protein n=1 Tax=Streptomyces sp. NPDC086777 TaxID=3154866 RepID=UPI00344EE13D
ISWLLVMISPLLVMTTPEPVPEGRKPVRPVKDQVHERGTTGYGPTPDRSRSGHVGERVTGR